MQKLAKKIQDAEKAGKEQTHKMNYFINLMADNSEKLVKELEKIPYVFVNGERSSFAELIQK